MLAMSLRAPAKPVGCDAPWPPLWLVVPLAGDVRLLVRLPSPKPGPSADAGIGEASPRVIPRPIANLSNTLRFKPNLRPSAARNACGTPPV